MTSAPASSPATPQRVNYRGASAESSGTTPVPAAQASSVYFSTLTTSNTGTCGGTRCAVKLTQLGLQLAASYCAGTNPAIPNFSVCGLRSPHLPNSGILKAGIQCGESDMKSDIAISRQARTGRVRALLRQICFPGPGRRHSCHSGKAVAGDGGAARAARRRTEISATRRESGA